ncbi:MAG: acetyl-CoA acetyltransferase [Natronomonas sp.]|jgi:acetyl-CoA acetyltransferase
MQEAVIVDAVRTPFGDRDGPFRDPHPNDLPAEPFHALFERVGFEPADIEDVVYGYVSSVGEQGLNIGRIAPMVAGWGDGVPGVQLNRMWGSGQQAVNFAAGQIRAGYHDILVAGGIEHMTRVPMGSDGDAEEGVVDEHAVTDTYLEYYDEITSQGEGAERIAEEYGFSRDDVDEDGHPRPGTTRADLHKLPMAFREEGDGFHHAGNSSDIVDGASALSQEVADERGWEPMARVVQTEIVGVDPV